MELKLSDVRPSVVILAEHFFGLYEPLVSTWRLYDGSGPAPRAVAERLELRPVRVYDEGVWSGVKQQRIV